MESAPAAHSLAAADIAPAPNPADTPFFPIVRLLHRLAMIVILGIAACLFIYAHPLVDDFWRATIVRELGLAGAMSNEYNYFTGRWLSTGLSYATSSLVDLRAIYPPLLAILAAALFASIYALVRSIWQHRTDRRHALALSTAFFALYWAIMPMPGQTFYWFTGNLENQLAVAVQLLFFAWLISIPPVEWTGPRLWLRRIGLTAAALAIPGFHELYGIIFCLILAAGVMALRGEPTQRRTQWILCLAAALLGLAIVVFAPGNAERMAKTPGARQLGPTLSMAIASARFIAANWVLSLPLLAATLLFLLHPLVMAFQPAWARRATAWKFIVPLIGATGVALGLVLAPWGAGQPCPPRTLNALLMLFLLTWFATAFLWTRNLTAGWLTPARHRILASAALAFFAITLLASPNVRNGASDLAGAAPKYDRALDDRYRLIETAIARGDNSVQLTPLPAQPLLFFHIDVVNNPDDYRNEHLREFFGLHQLTIADPEP